MKRLAITLAAAASLLALPVADATAWGASGHRTIGVAAMRGLPDDMPAFLRTAAAAADVGEMSREPDRWRGRARTHARERDTAHFIDMDEEGRVLGAAGPSIDELPELRSEYNALVTAAGFDVDDAGWLPYAIIDGYQQLVRDFATWRVLAAAEARETDPGKRAWYREDRERREALILRDIGVLGHYVGDASQPLHLTIHYNGWGDYPNPEGFTTSRQFHGQVDGFPFGRIAVPDIEAQMVANDCGTPCDIRARVPAYLRANLANVAPLYRLEQAGQIAEGGPEAVAFMSARMASGASELRDLVAAAYREAGTVTIGWPVVNVAEVEAGTADPWDSMFGAD